MPICDEDDDGLTLHMSNSHKVVTALIVMVFVEISLQSHGHIPVLLNSKK